MERKDILKNIFVVYTRKSIQYLVDYFFTRKNF